MMYNNNTTTDEDANRSLASHSDCLMGNRPSASLSPVERPFTSQITATHRQTHLPSNVSEGTGVEEVEDVHMLRPPRLELIASLYHGPGTLLTAADTATSTPPDKSWQSRDEGPNGSSFFSEAAANVSLDRRGLASFGVEETASAGSARLALTQRAAPRGASAAASPSVAAAASPTDADTLDSMCRSLPWWKVILLRRDYRDSLAELATTFYRAEMHALEQTPEQISSAQGKDRLKGTVMSQYIALPPHAVWAVRHPNSFIQHSALETMRTVALHAMPPTMNPQQRMQQVAAVEHHLRRQRRVSMSKTPAMKRCDGHDMLSGKVPLPDPFDTEAENILARNAALLAGPPPTVTVGTRHLREALGSPMSGSGSEALVVAPTPSGFGTAGAEATYGFGQTTLHAKKVSERAQQLALYHFPTPPPSPRSRARGYCTSVKAEETKETPYGTLVRSASRHAAQHMESARLDAQRARDEALSAAAPGGGLHLSPEEHARRLAEEALACYDGTNNLYGLSYFWESSFPPAGFIREAPEPRQAMWPDDVRDEAKRAEAARKAREAEALVERVNEREKKLQYCRRYGLRNNMAKLLKDEEAEVAKRAAQEAGAAAAEACLTDEQKQLNALKPLPDGPLNINIVRYGVDGQSPAAAAAASRVSQAQPSQPQPRKSDGVRSETPANPQAQLLGTFRQSLLLIHFKIYCCALHEEQRLRRCGPGAHVTAVPISSRLRGGVHGGSGRATSTEALDFLDEQLLADVPHIPSPVLRVQTESPELAKPGMRHTARLDRVHAATCWEGLIPSVPQDATHAAVHVWRYLHQASFASRQSVRDVFNSLDHDADGRLVKQTYVEFILDLLHLFFPTHLHDVHIAIAEEEWAYRGTTENVSFAVFFEKFFSLPFMFHRRIADVTEDDYVEFWSLVRVCLFESAKTAPTLMSFEKTLMMPATAGEVAAALAGTLPRGTQRGGAGGVPGSSSHMASPLSSTTRTLPQQQPQRQAGAPAALDGVRGCANEVFVEAAGSPMRVKKVTGTCTASTAEKMREQERKQMRYILGTNASLAGLATNVKQQQQQQGQDQPDSGALSKGSNDEDTGGTTRSTTLTGADLPRLSAARSGKAAVSSEVSMMSKAESVVALMQKEKSALKGVQAASSRYAAAVADGIDKNGTILMSAVFGYPEGDSRAPRPQHDTNESDESDDSSDVAGEDVARSRVHEVEVGKTRQLPAWRTVPEGKGKDLKANAQIVPSSSSSSSHPLRRRRRLSLLGPIMGFTPAQVLQLYANDYEHEEDYLLYQALHTVLQSDPVVQLLPPARQYGVALSKGHKLVQAHLATLQAARAAGEAEALADAKAARNRHDVGRHHSIGIDELGDGLLRGPEGAGMEAALRSALQDQKKAQASTHARKAQVQPRGRGATVGLGRQGSEQGAPQHGTDNRSKQVAEAAQLRRAVLQQLEEDRRLAQLLHNSDRYQHSKRRRQARFNKALAKIESTASSWELHVDGVYDLTEPEQSVEDRLLRYLRDVSTDVFDGRVSLRERFLVHERFIEERRRLGRERSGLSLPPPSSSRSAPAAGNNHVTAVSSTMAGTRMNAYRTQGGAGPLSAASDAAGTGIGSSAGILGLGYGDTVVRLAPAEARTVMERLQRMVQAPSSEEMYLASMDVRREQQSQQQQQQQSFSRAERNSTSGSVAPGESARAVILGETTSEAWGPQDSGGAAGGGGRRLLGGRHSSSHQLLSYAAGAYPVRPARVSLTGVGARQGQVNGVKENGAVGWQDLIDALLHDSLIGPGEGAAAEDNEADGHEDKTNNKNNKTSFGLGSRTSSGRRRDGGRRPRSPLLSFGDGIGVGRVLASPTTSDEAGSSRCELSGSSLLGDKRRGEGNTHAEAAGTPGRSVQHGRGRTSGGTSPFLKRIPSSKTLPSAKRATTPRGHDPSAPQTPARVRTPGNAEEEVRENASATARHKITQPQPHLLQAGSLRDEIDRRRAKFAKQTGQCPPSAAAAAAAAPSAVGLGGVPLAKGEALTPSSVHVLSPHAPHSTRDVTHGDQDGRSQPRASFSRLNAPFIDDADDARAATRLERHTEAILESLTAPQLMPKPLRKGAPKTAEAAHGVLEPHRPAPSGLARPLAAPPHTAREAMTAATRVLGISDSTRHYQDRFELANTATTARCAAEDRSGEQRAYGAGGSQRDVDLARRLASQRGREERWARHRAPASSNTAATGALRTKGDTRGTASGRR